MSTPFNCLINKVPVRIDCLISGYIKKEEAVSGIKIPNAIIRIFCVYYCIPFEFHKNKNDEEVSIEEDQKKAIWILNSGQTVSIDRSKCRCYPTIRFGDYMTSKDGYCKLRFTFVASLAKNGHIGIGFITNDFKEFEHNNFNYGKNHSMIIWSTSYGYFVTSDEFDSAQHKWHKDSYRDVKEKKTALRILDEGSNVTVEINMRERTAKITNLKNKSYFETQNLPDNVALAFSFGQNQPAEITCIKQEFL